MRGRSDFERPDLALSSPEQRECFRQLSTQTRTARLYAATGAGFEPAVTLHPGSRDQFDNHESCDEPRYDTSSMDERNELVNMRRWAGLDNKSDFWVYDTIDEVCRIYIR